MAQVYRDKFIIRLKDVTSDGRIASDFDASTNWVKRKKKCNCKRKISNIKN